MTEEAREWLRKAWDDFLVVEHEMALSEEERVCSAICFHAQQFVEKALKAFLILHGKEFPRTHNLSFLRELCRAVDEDFGRLPVDELSLYAVELRYPGTGVIIGLNESAKCALIAREVREFLERKLGIKFADLAGREERKKR